MGFRPLTSHPTSSGTLKSNFSQNHKFQFLFQPVSTMKFMKIQFKIPLVSPINYARNVLSQIAKFKFDAL